MSIKHALKGKFAVALASAALALAALPVGAAAFTMPNMGGGGPNIFSSGYTGDHVGTLMADGEEVSSEGETIENSTADDNAALAKNAGTLRLTDDDIVKTGDATDENSSLFYGVNAAVLATNEGSLVVMNGGTIDATGYGANAVVATDSGTVYLANVDIHTNAVTCHGVDSTYAGTIIADGLNIHTETTRSGAVATDNGGGTVSITNSTIEANGDAAPLVYSTGDIQLYNVTGTATGSQIGVIDNMNTLMAYKCDLTTTFETENGNAFNIYKSTIITGGSMTGERATLQLVQSKITSEIGAGTVISVKGNDVDAYIAQTEFVHDTENISFINVAAGSTLTGGDASPSSANVTLQQETVAGDIISDNASTVVVWFTDNSEWTGAASIVDPSADGVTAAEAPISFNVDETSTWVVTADSTVTNLNVANGGQVIDEDGKTVSIMMNGDPLVEGDSDLTVTVLGAYSTNFDNNGMIEIANDKLADRSGFDKELGLETAYTMELAAVEEPAEEPADDAEATDAAEAAEAPAAEETTAPAEDKASDTAAAADNTALYVVLGVIAAAVIAGVAYYFIKKNKAIDESTADTDATDSE